MQNKHKNYLWIIIAIVVVGAIFYFMSGGNTGSTKYDEFAQCLSNSGAAMYGAYWCPHCQEQKKEFGDSWVKVNYVECDAKGENGNPELCAAKGVEGYPTWIFADGTKMPGTQSMQTLASKTGCALP